MDVAILADEKIGMSGAAAPGGACLTRRSFVRLAGAAAVGAALGSAVLPLSGCAPAGDVLRVGGRTRRLEWSGGFFTKDDNGRWHSHRYVRNSLGSIVAVTDSAGTVEQAVCYYASGLPVYKAPNSIPATRRMHVGKELEQFESIDWYDNEARFYDPLLVRFTTPDPLALSYPSLSPYAYCANNPVCNVDLDGTIMDPNRDAVMPIVTPEQVESIINNSNTNKDAGKRIETEHDWRD